MADISTFNQPQVLHPQQRKSFTKPRHSWASSPKITRTDPNLLYRGQIVTTKRPQFLVIQPIRQLVASNLFSWLQPASRSKFLKEKFF